jgi:hypothetical protein
MLGASVDVIGTATFNHASCTFHGTAPDNGDALPAWVYPPLGHVAI